MEDETCVTCGGFYTQRFCDRCRGTGLAPPQTADVLRCLRCVQPEAFAAHHHLMLPDMVRLPDGGRFIARHAFARLPVQTADVREYEYAVVSDDGDGEMSVSDPMTLDEARETQARWQGSGLTTTWIERREVGPWERMENADA